MKAILRFNLSDPDDHRLFLLASKANQLALAVWDYDQQLRSWVKYGHEWGDEALDKAREALYDMLREGGLDIDDLA